MAQRFRSDSWGVGAAAAVVACVVALAGCSSSTTPTAATSTSTTRAATSTSTTPPTSTSVTTASTSTTSSVPTTGKRVALGTNNPAQGDCTTNATETATSVGFVVLNVTASSFQAAIQVQGGSPNTTYAVLMQQVPGSCPQTSDNGGTLTTDSAGRGHASTSVPRVPGATSFFLQLLPAGSGAPQYTSDRVSAGS